MTLRYPTPVSSFPTVNAAPQRHPGEKGQYEQGHEATDTGLAYAPVSQAHGHHHMQFIVLLGCSCSANQISTECCLEFATQCGYRMFLGLSGSAVPD